MKPRTESEFFIHLRFAVMGYSLVFSFPIFLTQMLSPKLLYYMPCYIPAMWECKGIDIL